MTSQPQGELREREQWESEIEKLTQAAIEAIAERDAARESVNAEVAATIERCTGILSYAINNADHVPNSEAPITAGCHAATMALLRGLEQNMRALATAPQTSALAVKMAEARLEEAKVWAALPLLMGANRQWVDKRIAELEQALAAAKER